MIYSDNFSEMLYQIKKASDLVKSSLLKDGESSKTETKF